MSALRSMYPDDAFVWAGDLNQTLEGRSLSKQASSMLRDAIENLGLKPVNAGSPHRIAGMNALDFICVESSWTCPLVESRYPLLDEKPLSDHRWYVADVMP
jgi:endonuclease/exonuclease/phosphatase family metal-dependent hydrolase